jgi:nitrite reductase/ring-hydroxylating ferredoxin subunit
LTADADPAKNGPLPLCTAATLEEKGRAFVWQVQQYRRPVRAFALRFDGRVRAYLNRCLHVPTEMDWQPGEFLDIERQVILCSIHGAAYRPTDGQCVGGPCGRGRLVAIRTEETDGHVYWYPSDDIQPADPSAAASPSSLTASDDST